MPGMTRSALSRKRSCLSIRRNACGSGKGGRDLSVAAEDGGHRPPLQEVGRLGKASLTGLRFSLLACLTGSSRWKGPVMTTALLYQPRQTWRVGVAFGATVLTHFAVIALANAHRDTKPEEPAGSAVQDV